ncbi:MAG: hypothetical protein QNL04_08580 [SAR324 cluster bacterium]|nr:hypothetical protein [SAR324 cluster bacterium]
MKNLQKLSFIKLGVFLSLFIFPPFLSPNISFAQVATPSLDSTQLTWAAAASSWRTASILSAGIATGTGTNGTDDLKYSAQDYLLAFSAWDFFVEKGVTQAELENQTSLAKTQANEGGEGLAYRFGESFSIGARVTGQWLDGESLAPYEKGTSASFSWRFTGPFFFGAGTRKNKNNDSQLEWNDTFYGISLYDPEKYRLSYDVFSTPDAENDTATLNGSSLARASVEFRMGEILLGFLTEGRTYIDTTNTDSTYKEASIGYAPMEGVNVILNGFTSTIGDFELTGARLSLAYLFVGW